MARASIALTENFGDLLDSRFTKIFQTEYEENIKESMIPFLYGMRTSSKNYEKLSGVGGGSDLSTFDGQITYDTISQLYDVEVSFPEKAKGMKIERKLYDDDLFGIMDQRPRNLAIDAARTREKEAATTFNNAFIGTGGGDSQPLCSSSHPFSPDDATTQSNAGSSAMDASTIEATRRLAHTSVFNDRGELMNINYDLILCTVALEETAWEIINSKGKVETANNNRNFHYGRYKLAVWDRLTDSNNWFMIDSKLQSLFNLWYTRVPVQYFRDRDFDTLQAKWAVYKRENTVFAAHQWIYGHNVT
jgi:hypothetical protein